MELRQLSYLVTVVEEASFTRAAARLHVAQPGVSAQIRQLERELGQPLLDRSGRTVRPTEVGAAVLPYARAALDAVAGARASVEQLTGLLRGHVQVGTVSSVTSVDLPGLVADFHRVHPHVDLTLCEDTADHLVESVRAGRLDVAFVGAAPEAPAGVRAQIVADEALVLVVAPDDVLAGRESVPVTALRERTLVSLPAGAGLRHALDEVCAAAGFRPRVAFEAGDPHTLTRFVARGLGVAVLPGSVAREHGDRVRVVELSRLAVRARIALCWRDDGPVSPAARAFTDHARARLATPAGREPAGPGGTA